ncbi:hypothetical protein [Mycobacterium sp. ACS4331]|uniref:hypothetical protein n=1 Tax=Mycobacterium sp. ACS4331 TaxID=1834121 RepID=UPI0008022DEA|nr:hypothetical protein [Mycobacterium sp. ACS4331]OBF11677.1 hypothetical protein A5727_19405 [Mycobacterium sp. ACS4331]
MAAPFLVRSPESASWVTDHHAEALPSRQDMAKRASRLSRLLTEELLAESQRADVPVEHLVTAALGRTIGRAIGAGELVVRLDGESGPPATVTLACTAEWGLGGADAISRVQPAGRAVTPMTLVSYRSSVEGTSPEAGCLLVLHTRLGADVLYLDWWYDTRSFDAATIAELDEQFPLAMVATTSG